MVAVTEFVFSVPQYFLAWRRWYLPASVCSFSFLDIILLQNRAIYRACLIRFGYGLRLGYRPIVMISVISQGATALAVRGIAICLSAYSFHMPILGHVAIKWSGEPNSLLNLVPTSTHCMMVLPNLKFVLVNWSNVSLDVNEKKDSLFLPVILKLNGMVTEQFPYLLHLLF